MKYETVAHKFHSLSNNQFNEWFDKRFHSESTFHFDIHIGKDPAFFYYEVPLFNKILSLQQKNDMLNSIFLHLPAIASSQYIRNSLVIDVKKTNEIEGVFSSKKEIFELSQDLKKCKSNKVGSIVNKYIMLLKDDSKEKLSSCKDIRNIYDELFLSGDETLIDPDKLPDGELFRKNYVGVYDLSKSEPIHKGIVPEEKIIHYLNVALSILNDQTLNKFVRVAIFHYIFEYVHPFYDGNGRIGRYLISLFFKKEISTLFAFRISAGINNYKKQYYKAFESSEDVLNKGDMTLFVYEFLDILDKTYDDCIQYAKEKEESLKIEYKNYCSLFSKLSKNEDRVLFVLTQASIFSDFGITIKEIKETLDVSIRTIRRCFETFNSKRILKEQKYSRCFYYSLKRE